MRVRLLDINLRENSVSLVFAPVNGHTDLHPEHANRIGMVTISLDFPDTGTTWDLDGVKFDLFDE